MVRIYTASLAHKAGEIVDKVLRLRDIDRLDVSVEGVVLNGSACGGCWYVFVYANPVSPTFEIAQRRLREIG